MSLPSLNTRDADISNTGEFCIPQQATRVSSAIRTGRSQSSTKHCFGFTPRPPIPSYKSTASLRRNKIPSVLFRADLSIYRGIFPYFIYSSLYIAAFFSSIWCWHCTGGPGLVTQFLSMFDSYFPWLTRGYGHPRTSIPALYFLSISPDTFCCTTLPFLSFFILPCDNCLATRGFGGGGRARRCWDGGPDSRTVVVSRSQHTRCSCNYLPTLQLKLRLLAGVKLRLLAGVKQTATFETSTQSHSLPCVVRFPVLRVNRIVTWQTTGYGRSRKHLRLLGTFSTFSPRGARRGRCPGAQSTMHVSESGDPSAGCLVTILKASRLVA